MSSTKRKRTSAVVFFNILLLGLAFESAATRDELVVNTKSGRVRGLRYYPPTGKGKVVDAFLGIPFAKPPIGQLRFKHAQPLDPWEGTYNATTLPNSCYQIPDLNFGSDFRGSNMWNSPTRVSEDCLYLNVWVPRGSQPRTPPHRMAVMVWIYGGGFYSGTITLDLYDGRILATENNVIVVSMNYRLGAFGFLSLNHHSAPANAALFDQLMALDWVQENIRAFGGDPNNVTLFGESAGAASVSLHLLSPLSRNKFHRAIMQSGTANMPWVALTMEEAKRRSLELAVEILGCPQSDDMEVVTECLRNTLPQTLADFQYVTSHAMQFPFLPVIDGTFLPDSPDELLRRQEFKKCPILIGSNKNEGSFFIIYELYQLLTLDSTKMNRQDFVDSMRIIFYYFPQYRQVMSPAALDAVMFQYTNWLDPDDSFQNAQAIDGALGDSQFICPLNHFAHTYAMAGESVYMYYLTQRYASNPWPDWMGVLHGDEIMYMFGEALKPGHNYSQADKDLSRKMMDYWTNFAKTGSALLTCGACNLEIIIS